MFRSEAFGHENTRRRTPPTDFDCYRAQAAALNGSARRAGTALRRGGTTVAGLLCLIIVMLLTAA